jgi:hypothetical protein
MDEHEEKRTVEALRTKRLGIVDDEGKVRAMLGTNENGVAAWTAVFDQSDC